MFESSLSPETADHPAPAPSGAVSGTTPRAAWRPWLAWFVVVHGLLLGVFLANQPIAPRALDAAASVFSEARARRLLAHLTQTIGLRLSGTANAERAAQYLADQLRAIPGVEVDVQRVADAHHLHGTFVPWPVIKYRVTNVVARIPGRTRDAVLLDAHFDTLGDSPGAGDDGIGVASIVEAARALAAGPQLERSVIILCNGGEEYGLYGADGFIRNHPLAKDVRAYLYIDGGPGGAATLLYSGPGTDSLVEAYARVAPRPQADSAYLDLIESGVLSHDGDHRPFRDQGLPGLLLATIGDLWAPHTKLDNYERLEPGAIQHVGQTVLEVARLLANRSAPLPAGIEPERSIYVDVFGAWLVRYRASTGIGLAALTALLAAAAMWRASRSRQASVRDVAYAWLGGMFSGVAAVLGATMAGVVLSYLLRRSYGWYSAPWLAYGAFVVPACAASAAVQAYVRRRANARGHDLVWGTWIASVIGWNSLSLLAALSHARSGYIPLAWAFGLSLGLLAAQRWPAARSSMLLAACLPGLYTLVHLAPMLRTLQAQAGIQALAIPADPLVGALCGLLVAAAGAAIALPMQAWPAQRTVVKALVSLSFVGIALCAAARPFSAERPRRILVTQAQAAGRSAFLLRARDALALDPVLEHVPGARPARPDWTQFDVYEPVPTHEAPGPAPDFDPPRVDVLSSNPNADGTRTVTLRLSSQTPNLRVFIEAGRVARWSVHPEVAEPPLAGGRATIYFQGVDPEGETLSLTLRGSAPAEIEVVASTFAPSTALKQFSAAFPPWALPVPLCARSVKQQI